MIKRRSQTINIIKAANIMFRPNGDICLIDYNIALALGEDGAVKVGFSRGYPFADATPDIQLLHRQNLTPLVSHITLQSPDLEGKGGRGGERNRGMWKRLWWMMRKR